MFIDRALLRINIYAPFTDPDGITYPNLLNADLRAAFGVTEVAEPQPPADYTSDTYYRIEQDTAPYVVYAKKGDDQIKQQNRAAALREIQMLESGQARAVREAALGDPTHLKEIDAKITLLRSQL